MELLTLIWYVTLPPDYEYSRFHAGHIDREREMWVLYVVYAISGLVFVSNQALLLIVLGML